MVSNLRFSSTTKYQWYTETNPEEDLQNVQGVGGGLIAGHNLVIMVVGTMGSGNLVVGGWGLLSLFTKKQKRDIKIWCEEHIFHHEEGQTLEQVPREAVRSLSGIYAEVTGTRRWAIQ